MDMQMQTVNLGARVNMLEDKRRSHLVVG